MLWTLDDAAAFLRLSRRTVYRMVLDGRLPGHKIGGHWRLFKPEIMEALKLNDLRG